MINLLRMFYSFRNKMRLRQKMKHYFGSCTNFDEYESNEYKASLDLGPITENDYERPSSRTRSPTDPLPPLTLNVDDVPGYLKLKNYEIFNPHAEMDQY